MTSRHARIQAHTVKHHHFPELIPCFVEYKLLVIFLIACFKTAASRVDSAGENWSTLPALEKVAPESSS